MKPPTMQALRWHGRRDVRVDTVPQPTPGLGQVLVRVERVGLCGTDTEEFLHGPVDIGPEVPVILGHEIVGRVAACPGGELEIGTRVVPDVVIGCGQCWWCQRHEPGQCPRLVVLGLQADGGLAEFMLAEAGTCVVVPAALDLDVAVFAEPTAVAVRGVRKCGDLAGASVAVVGLGTVGNLVVQVAAASSATEVIGVDPSLRRRELAEQLGATAALAPDPGLIGIADVVVDCAGTDQSARDAIAMARTGGTIVMIGTGSEDVSLPLRSVVLKEKRILGSAAHVWDEDVQAAVALLARGVVRPQQLISRVVSLADVVEDGFLALERDTDLIKVVAAP